MGESSNEIEIKDGIIKANFNELDSLIRMISGKFGICKADRDDLYQTGWIVCLECEKRYDPKRNDSFVGYVRKALEVQIAKNSYDMPKMASICGFDFRGRGYGDTRSAILGEVDKLDELPRDLIYSHYYHEMTVHTWARKRGISTESAFKILREALDKLRESLLSLES